MTYPWSEFLNDYEEIHAVWFGFANVVKPSHLESVEEENCRLCEPHYYVLGEILGQATLGVIAIVLLRLGLTVV